MGKRGPASKPTNLKVLQGNPGRRPINEKEPKFPIADEVPSPPSYLSTYAKKEWKRIAPLLHRNRLLTEADISILAGYCQAYNRWIEAEKLIRTYGYTSETDKGNIIQRPEVGIANKALDEMLKYAKEFGLTPSSRANLHVENAEDVDDPFMQFIRGGKNG